MTVKLYARIYLGDGKSKWVAVKTGANHRHIPVRDTFDYCIQFTDPLKGKQVQVSCKTTDLHLAVAAMKRKEAELLDGIVVSLPTANASASANPFARMTLADAREKYLSNCEARGLDHKTIRAYTSAIEPRYGEVNWPD